MVAGACECLKVFHLLRLPSGVQGLLRLPSGVQGLLRLPSGVQRSSASAFWGSRTFAFGMCEGEFELEMSRKERQMKCGGGIKRV